MELLKQQGLAGLVGELMQAMHRYDGGRMLPLVHAAKLTTAQLAVLEYVQVARTVSAVAVYAGLSRPATSAMVDKLVRRGLVRRTEGLVDRRERAVMLSAAGRALVEKVHAARVVRFAASLAVLPPRSAARLRGALREALKKLRSADLPAEGRQRRRR